MRVACDSAQLLLHTSDHCGESVTWHGEQRAVYWIDNRRNLVHRLIPDLRSLCTWKFEETVAALVLTEDPQVLCLVLGSRLLLWNPSTDERKEYGFPLDGWPMVRYNEAGVDPMGRLWLGSMANNANPDGSRRQVIAGKGSLIRIDSDGATIMRQKIGIVNTIAWNPAGSCLYSGDTLANEIRSYRFDKKYGDLNEPTSFLKGFPSGRPDGSAIDREGSLWNCRYGGGCIIRVSPSGEIQERVMFPTSNVTSCAFGGPSLTTLYVTTALSDASAATTDDGGLFAVPASVAGHPLYRHRLVSLSSGHR